MTAASVASAAAPLGRREQTKLANRQAILKAAREVFLARGFELVTIRDIVRASGLSAGTFYNYFPDKDAVIGALVEDRIAEITRDLSQIRQDAKTLQTFVSDTYALVFRASVQDPLFYALIFRNQAVAQTVFHDTVFDISVTALEQDVATAQANGLIDPTLDPHLLAAACFGVGTEIGQTLAQWAHAAPPADVARQADGRIDAAVRHATQIFLRGIGPPAG